MALNVSTNKKYFIRNYASGLTADTAMYLNVWGTELKGNTQPIKLHQLVEGDKLQVWSFASDPTNKTYIKVESNPEFALNINTLENPICTLYEAKGNSDDGLVKLIPVNDAEKVYKIELVAHPGLFLTAKGLERGAVVAWAKDEDSALQKWQFSFVNPADTEAEKKAAAEKVLAEKKAAEEAAKKAAEAKAAATAAKTTATAAKTEEKKGGLLSNLFKKDNK